MNTLQRLDFTCISEIMMQMVTKAIDIIREESLDIVVDHKTHYDGQSGDIATNGDRRAQEMYVQEITRHFAGFGVIAEEKALTIPCRIPDEDIYFTVDPLDGTKAYERGASNGVGTMISLTCNNQVVAVCIGDANTGEIYGFADNTLEGAAFRYRFGHKLDLQPELAKPLTAQYLMLREAPWIYPRMLRQMMQREANKGLFKNIEVGGGSIGLQVARLWKGEVGGLFLEPGYETPWDRNPVIGILKRLGFVCFGVDVNNPNMVRRCELQPYKVVAKEDLFRIIIHKLHEKEMLEWVVQHCEFLKLGIH